MATEQTTTRSARRIAALAVALILIPIGLVAGACASWTEHAAISTESTAPQPCIVGSPRCGPLPEVPKNGRLGYDSPGPSPRNGPLRAGSYSSGSNQTGIHLGFTVPAGWRWNGRTLSKGNAAVSFYASPVLVYADPCHWHRPQHPSIQRRLDSNIMRLLAAQPMRDASRPIMFRPEGPFDAIAIRLTVPSNLDISRCDHGQYRTWGVGRNTLLAHGPGERDLIWISGLPWTSKMLLVDAATFPTTPTRLVDQVDAILASIDACAACGP